MYNSKKYISLIEILLIISIILAISSIFVKYFLVNPNTYFDILNKNNVYLEVKDSLYKKMDSMLNEKNIHIDIKESIITEEDIKKEAENSINGFTDYLKTGQNNIKPIDTDMYKNRVSDILKSIINGALNKSNKELSLNDRLQIENTSLVDKGYSDVKMLNIENTNQKLKFDNILLVNNNSKDMNSKLVIEKLMTPSEAEAKVREILRQKGLTEEQAIQKAKEKGITQEQAIRILEGYGVKIDGDSESSNNNSQNSSGKSSDMQKSNTSGNDKAATDNNSENTSKNTSENNITQSPNSRNEIISIDSILNKLLDEANSNIDKEIEKLNLNKLAQSSKLQNVAKVTSILFKLHWLFLLLPFVLSAIIVKINGKNYKRSLKYIGQAFIISGTILFIIFFGGYISKFYENVNINTIYLKSMISDTAKYFLLVLCKSSIAVFFIGTILFLPTRKIKEGN